MLTLLQKFLKPNSLGLLFVLGLPLTLAAQSNYQDGLVVTTQGDTLRGQINQMEWEKNPTTVSFKSKTSPEEKKFTTSDIQYFEITGQDFYQRFEVSISMDKVALDNGITSRDTKITSTSGVVFLKILARGKNVTLFSYKDQVKTRYYLAYAESPVPQELIYRLIVAGDASSAESPRIGFLEGYKNQLTSAAQVRGVLTDNLRSRINKTTYGDNLITMANLINGQIKSKEKKKTGAGTYFYLSAGLNSTTTSPYSGGTSSNLSFFPYVGLGYDIAKNPNVGRLHFAAEGMLTAATNKVDGSLSKLSQTTFNLSLLVKYNLYNGKKVKCFLGAGIRLSVAHISADYSPSYVASSAPKDWIFWPSVPVRAGVTLNQKVELSVSYTALIGLVTLGNEFYTISNTQVGLSYRLK